MNHMEKAKRQGGNAWKLWSKRFAVLALVAWCTMGYARPPKQGDVVAVERAGAREAVRMADKRWAAPNSGGPVNMNVAGNWLPSGVPGAADKIIFDGSVSQAAVQGNRGGGTLTAAYDGVVVLENFSPDMGSSGNEIGFDTPYFVFGGSGRLIYYPLTTAAHHFYMRSNSGSAYYNNSDTGVGGSVYMGSGSLDLENQYPLTRLVIDPISDNCYLTTSSSANGCTNYVQYGGVVETDQILGSSSSVIAGGTLEYGPSNTTTWPSLTVVGGTVVWNTAANITTCILESGTMDFSQDYRTKTIGTMVIGKYARLIDHENIIYTTKIDLREPYGKFP